MDDTLAFWKVYVSYMNSKQVKRLTDTFLKCRFCGRNSNDVTFNMMPHAVPELLGANNIIVGDECDNCNQFFAASESHLARFLGPWLTMGAVKGKKKIPQFESRTDRNDPTTKTIVRVPVPEKREIILDSLDDYRIDRENKRMSLNFRVANIIPALVYKALVKIAMSLLPIGELYRYRKTMAGLLNEPVITPPTFPWIFLSIITKKKFNVPYVELYKRKAENTKGDYSPELTMVIGSGQTVLQVFLPEADDFDNTQIPYTNLSLELFPSIIFDVNENLAEFSFRHYDLSSIISITFDEQITFKFKDGEFEIPASD